jgi:hypothetical protein
MNKRTLSFAGILIAFLFLLAINTNALSFISSEEEGEKCYGCYDEDWTSGGLCTVGDEDPAHIRVCRAEENADQCNDMHMYGCCEYDHDKNGKDLCDLIGDPPTSIKCKEKIEY